MRRIIALVIGIAVGVPTASEAAQQRKSPLTNAPAIRKRLELRNHRFEFGVGAGVTIGQDFYNAVLVMPRLSYHFTDWIALGLFGGFNVTQNWKSTFNSDLQSALPKADPDVPNASNETNVPTPAQASATMNRIGYVGGGQIEFLPLAGKLALLGNAFMYFDLYVFAGPAVVNLITKGSLPAECYDPGLIPSDGKTHYYSCDSAASKGLRVAGNFGLGAHAFLNNYMALTLEIRDLLYKNNTAGRDVDGNGIVNNSDLEFTNNWVFSTNLQIFLPIKTRSSR